jgi:DNA replication and repair protein RecF
VVRHGPKQCDARRASTGEQKALLVGLVLAHARLVAAMSGIAPLVLLDEIAAHFDPLRRRALFDALTALGGQIWMTGADLNLFEDLRGRADIFAVAGGKVAPVSRDEGSA